VGPPNKQTNYEPIYKLPKTPEENSDNGERVRSTVNHRKTDIQSGSLFQSGLMMLPALKERLGPRPLLLGRSH